MFKIIEEDQMRKEEKEFRDLIESFVLVDGIGIPLIPRFIEKIKINKRDGD